MDEGVIEIDDVNIECPGRLSYTKEELVSKVRLTLSPLTIERQLEMLLVLVRNEPSYEFFSRISVDLISGEER